MALFQAQGFRNKQVHHQQASANAKANETEGKTSLACLELALLDEAKCMRNPPPPAFFVAAAVVVLSGEELVEVVLVLEVAGAGAGVPGGGGVPCMIRRCSHQQYS